MLYYKKQKPCPYINRIKYLMFCNVLGALCNFSVIQLTYFFPGITESLNNIPIFETIITTIIIVSFYYSVDIVCRSFIDPEFIDKPTISCEKVYASFDIFHLLVTFSLIIGYIVLILANTGLYTINNQFSHFPNWECYTLTTNIELYIMLAITMIILAIFIFWTSKSVYAITNGVSTYTNIIIFPIISFVSIIFSLLMFSIWQTIIYFIFAFITNAIYIYKWNKNDKLHKQNKLPKTNNGLPTLLLIMIIIVLIIITSFIVYKTS